MPFACNRGQLSATECKCRGWSVVKSDLLGESSYTSRHLCPFYLHNLPILPRFSRFRDFGCLQIFGNALLLKTILDDTCVCFIWTICPFLPKYLNFCDFLLLIWKSKDGSFGTVLSNTCGLFIPANLCTSSSFQFSCFYISLKLTISTAAAFEHYLWFCHLYWSGQ